MILNSPPSAVSQIKKPNKPFIIRRNFAETLIPKDSGLYNETLETYVRFVQGVNLFIVVFLSWETFQDIYLYFAYKSGCSDYTYWLVAEGVVNFFWIIIALSGLRSIASRVASSVKRYMLWLLLVLISRTVFYVLMDRQMRSQTTLNNWYCDAIYEGGFYIISAIMEAFLILLTLLLSKKVAAYIQLWEDHQKIQILDSHYVPPEQL